MNKIITANYTKAFKDGDIRGTYPAEIDESVAYYAARGFIDEFKYKKIVVGHDMRLSTPALLQAFIAGAQAEGCSVVSIGLVTSPTLYFASAILNLPGAMITASHSPRDYNGIKFVHSGAIPLTRRSGLAKIKDRISAMKFKDAKKPGKLTHKDIKKPTNDTS